MCNMKPVIHTVKTLRKLSTLFLLCIDRGKLTLILNATNPNPDPKSNLDFNLNSVGWDKVYILQENNLIYIYI